jgi:hypothetical protein
MMESYMAQAAQSMTDAHNDDIPIGIGDRFDWRPGTIEE